VVGQAKEFVAEDVIRDTQGALELVECTSRSDHVENGVVTL
jgi:hypothetical protein